MLADSLSVLGARSLWPKLTRSRRLQPLGGGVAPLEPDAEEGSIVPWRRGTGGRGHAAVF